MDVRRRCLSRRTYLQIGFEWNVEHLKVVKSRLDLEILKEADIIGMTTTGKWGEGAPNFYILIYVRNGSSASTCSSVHKGHSKYLIKLMDKKSELISKTSLTGKGCMENA